MNMEFSLAICLVVRMNYEYGVQPCDLSGRKDEL